MLAACDEPAGFAGPVQLFALQYGFEPSMVEADPPVVETARRPSYLMQTTCWPTTASARSPRFSRLAAVGLTGAEVDARLTGVKTVAGDARAAELTGSPRPP
jgi:hypothetical protein